MRNRVTPKPLACRLLIWSWSGVFSLIGLVAFSPAQAQFSRPAATASGPALGVAVRDIRVEGLQRIEPGTVFSYLPIQIGDRVTEQGTAEAVRTLFATGFFKDVRIELEGDVLVITVEERPAIGAVEITGSKEFDKDRLIKALGDLGLAESRIFDRALLDRAEQELKRQYLGRGKYNVRILSTVTPLERNRVAVQIAIIEGDDARIGQIRILGAKAFQESQLLREFRLSTANWASWYSKSDQYSRQKLTGDLEALRSFYLDRGYLEFSIDSTQVSLSPDRRTVFITIIINEGQSYTVKSVRLAGDVLGREREFSQLISIKPNQVFSNQKLQEVSKSITDRLGELGYAFASVTPIPELDQSKGHVNFILQVDPGKRVYVRNVTISGNDKTRDEVIRREMRQLESAWYDGERIRLSRNRIDRLGFFKDVDIDTVPVLGTQDQIDVNVKVEERPLGAITLGAGFSSTEKFVIQGSLTQQNFMGTGTNLALVVNTSQLQTSYGVSHSDPYWTDDGISRSLDAYHRKYNPSYIYPANNYSILSQGLSARFGVPYTELDRLFVGATLEASRYEIFGTVPTFIARDRQDFGANPQAYILSVGWNRDSRNSALAPTRGQLQYINFDYATPIGELQYLRTTYGNQIFTPIGKNITLANNLNVGSGLGLNGKTYPTFKNFTAGGIGSVRGFVPGGIGPVIDGRSPGGNVMIVSNNELLFPFPGLAQDRTIRLLTFVDIGSVWDDLQKFDLGDVRASLGFGLSWTSPVGPLKLTIGRAVKREEFDRTQYFQFNIGTVF